MPSPSTPTIAPGAHIELRDAIWRVVRIDPTSSGTQAWRCVGISEIVREQEAIFLEEFEPDVRVLDPRETKLERDGSSQHRAGLLYIESLLRDVPPPDDALYIGHGAAMDLIDFQLDPAWKALSQPRQRILIADSVGLGKTLEAGILLSELIRRGRGRRILVATTKAMLTQFQKEMWARFTIPLVRLDSLGLSRIRADIPSHHNPFYFFDKTIISIDTLKQNNWFRTHVEKAHWDVIVIDEAHNVATRGGGESQRAGIAAKLARNCDSLILLSATPHDGKAESFASLMNMLDPTAIADPSDYTKDDIKGLYVRRFKHEVRDQLVKHIPERTVMEGHATASPEEEVAFDLLTAIKLSALDKAAKGGVLFRTGLTKALFSSPRACLSQLRSPLRRERISKAIPEPARKVLLDPDQTPTAEALERAVTYLPHDPVVPDLLALAALARAVDAIGVDGFSKYHKLLDTLDRIGWKIRRAKEDRLVIFTERRETLAFLADQLVDDLGLKEGQWEILHGGLSDIEQQRIVEDFGKAKARLRLLLASDVASEGLNLHYLCHRMIHFDMPWSLMVFQQRNGRIDRYGQTEPPQIVYLQTDSVNETIKGDTRILEVLRIKSEQADKNIGDPSAFMGVFDVEEEEHITARAMQDGTSPEQLEAKLDEGLLDPFAIMMGAGAAPPPDVAPVQELPSLFASDFDYFTTGLERLKETEKLKAKVRPIERLVELRWPDDLKRRFRKLPTEVRPSDGVVLLTADPARMQRALDEARKEENAWPLHQLLWANSPVVSWLSDRLRAEFGRHTAPVLASPRLGGPDDVAVIVSGLLPNRRGQPLVHRWYVPKFAQGRLTSIEAFDDYLAATSLGRKPLPNAGDEVDMAALSALLPVAVDAVLDHVKLDRDQFRQHLRPRLDEELARLERLQSRQLDFLDELFADKTDARSTNLRSQRERRVRRLFSDYQEWMRDAMTTAEDPFLQVVAVLVGGVR